MFSSPIGESTFSTNESSKEEHGRNEFSSPIGESTFSTMTQSAKKNTKASFRPLSGNLLSLQIVSEYSYGDNIVFVPYRGIYFLYEIKEGCTMYDVDRFRPLSGNLLSLPTPKNLTRSHRNVFVPYRGIYFLYRKKKCRKL